MIVIHRNTLMADRDFIVEMARGQTKQKFTHVMILGIGFYPGVWTFDHSRVLKDYIVVFSERKIPPEFLYTSPSENPKY